MNRWLLGGLIALSLAGCATVTTAPELPPDPWQPAEAYALWESVLDGHVDERGRVDFAALEKRPESLERFVAWVYEVGPNSHPEAFPDSEHRLAYYINSYNALAMYAALDAGTPQHLNLLDRFRFFVLRKVQYGGEKISLYDYENEVIRAERDARIHFALNCMVVSCPRLPREAFVAARLEAQLDAAAREFLQSAKHVQLDQDQSMVRFSAILDFYTEDFLAEADSLIAYANRFRDEPIPESFAIGFLDYDWTLNRQP